MEVDSILGDWRKEAAAARNTDKAQQEQAFMNLAYGRISQKAGKLMEDPHRLGFEISYSNEDSSKMAGMMAFRIGNQMVSVPVIFINNDVKATDLLYEHSKKLIRCLTPEWADYLVSKYHHHEATPQDPTISNKMDSGMDLGRVTSSRSIGKSAASKQAWEEFFEAYEAQDLVKQAGTEDPSVLREFMLDAGQNALEKLANAMDASFDFAHAMAHLPEEDWLVDFPVTKEASAGPADLEVYTDVLDAPLSKMATVNRDNSARRGWAIVDNRETKNPIVEKGEYSFEEVSTPGKYDIVMAGGEMKTLYAFLSPDDRDVPLSSCGSTAEANSSSDLKSYYCPESKSFRTFYDSYGKIFGVASDENGFPARLDDDDAFSDKPSNGWCLPVDVCSGIAYDPIRVKSTKKRSDGVCVIEACNYSWDDEESRTIIHNPDASESRCDNKWNKSRPDVFGANVKFLKLSKDSKSSKNAGSDYKRLEGSFGSMVDTLQASSNLGLTHGEIKKDEGTNLFTVTEKGNIVGDSVDGVGTTTKSAAWFGIDAEEAAQLVDQADEHGSVSFIVDTSNELEKSAMTVQVVGAPNYQTSSDSDLGVNVEDSSQAFQLPTRQSQPTPSQRRYGDAYDPSMGNGSNFLSDEAVNKGITEDQIFNMPPEQLAELQAQSGAPDLFQHGVVGSLVSAYDSSALVTKYLPKLEEGLDHFGRIIFLFYWKPSDFEQLYGADDLTSMEQQLLSQFKSFGDILLELLRKNAPEEGAVVSH